MNIAETSPAHRQLVAAIRATLAECDSLDDGFRTSYGTRCGWNLPEALAAALTDVALADGSERLVEHRPGCWEADHIRALDMSALVALRQQ